ncbi:MAG TPA: hypothetical protein VKD90_08860, partial [Gemmataceae bacterium]|nr:hypothetical protein [Gemmataceae bacterium]
MEVKQNNNCVLIHRSGGDLARVKNAEYVTGVNPKYAFQIKRTVGDKDWVIDQIDLGGDGSQLPLGLRMPQREAAEFTVCNHFRIWDRQLTLERLFEKPNLKLTKTERITMDGTDMVRIEFDCPHPPERRKEPGFSAVQGGHLVLDPSHYWCIREYSVRTDDSVSKRHYSVRFEYSDGRDRFPVLRAVKADQIGYRPDGQEWFRSESEQRFELRQSEDEYDDHEFTLSAYGLPEPHGVTWERRTPLYVWLLTAAAGCAVL